MDVKKFWYTLLIGFVALAVVYGGVFLRIYLLLDGKGEGPDGPGVAMTVLGGLVSFLWCIHLFWWAYSLVMDKIRRFLLTSTLFLVLVIGITELAFRIASTGAAQ